MAYFFLKPIPVCRLLREESGVFEAEWLKLKGKAAVMDRPLFRQRKKFPLSAAFCASVIVSVGVFPALMYLFGVPDNLDRKSVV